MKSKFDQKLKEAYTKLNKEAIVDTSANEEDEQLSPADLAKKKQVDMKKAKIRDNDAKITDAELKQSDTEVRNIKR
jgi:hypothetical protein|tara:strand:+ start:77529 stop:77756 length:228 start_codon:yes stop_codon:yes gene_type:complete